MIFRWKFVLTSFESVVCGRWEGGNWQREWQTDMGAKLKTSWLPFRESAEKSPGQHPTLARLEFLMASKMGLSKTKARSALLNFRFLWVCCLEIWVSYVLWSFSALFFRRKEKWARYYTNKKICKTDRTLISVHGKLSSSSNQILRRI